MIDRFYLDTDTDGDFVIKDRQNDLVVIRSMKDATYMLNKIDKDYENLRYLIINAEKRDDGGFQVWEVPPIKHGMRITTHTSGCEPK